MGVVHLPGLRPLAHTLRPSLPPRYKARSALHERRVCCSCEMWRGSGWSCRALCAVLCVLGAGQVVSSLSADPPGCQPGFSSAEYTFTVKRRQLERGRKLGKVSFTDCTTWKNGMFDVGDSRFHVTPDGTVKVKHHVKLHTDVKFTISSWDVGGHKFSAVVTVNTRHRLAKESRNGPSELPVLLFPEKRTGLHRRKRDWVIPPIRVPENERGPFPKHLVQIKSNKDQGTKVLYSITGQGADSHPEGVFGIERETGWMTVTRPLDREQYSKYVLLSHAVSENGQPVEDPMEIIISVIDQNDNRPAFTQDVFKGFVREGVQPGTPVMNVTATDDDDAVETFNAVLGYSILKQEPDEPTAGLFTINRNTGLISVIGAGLDRERIPKYTLIVEAADMDGTGLTTTATAIIEIVDANDNAPIFDPKTYTVTVPENRGDFEVQRLSVTDLDQAGTPAWLAVYKISGLNSLNNSFSITTDPETNDGILITAKGLDFETKKQYVLQITVENVDPFTVQLPTSTATVTVNVEDVNEAPYFEPTISRVSVLEDLPLGQKVVSLIAQDPDKQQIQKLSFSIGNDPAGWLTVNPNTGIVTGNGNLDRESAYVKNNTYTVIMLVTDDGFPSGTGTGTIILNVLDVNDNGPVPSPRTFSICNQDPEPQVLSVHDDDLPPNTYPFTVELLYGSESMWMVDLKDEGKTMLLTPIEDIKVGDYNLYIRLSDAQLRQQLTVVNATVCDCTGSTVHCSGFVAAGVNLPIILVILGSILALLILILLLLLFLKRRKVVKEPLLLPEDDTRDNILNYSEEAGEEDQDFDLAQLHRGLDARPDVIRNDVAPVSMPGPQYRPRPSNPQEIGNFINENLDAADNDPTAPPYDSLLVFDYEGSGSEAASLSSLNSSSDGDYDYNYLGEWGPRFKKLADLYGDDDDDE